MTAYVITKGSFEAYQVVGVCLDKDKAEELAAMCEGDIREIETDTYTEGGIMDRCSGWTVTFDNDGKVVKAEARCPRGTAWFAEGVSELSYYSVRDKARRNVLNINVWAENCDEAIQLAEIKREQHVSQWDDDQGFDLDDFLSRVKCEEEHH